MGVFPQHTLESQLGVFDCPLPQAQLAQRHCLHIETKVHEPLDSLEARHDTSHLRRLPVKVEHQLFKVRELVSIHGCSKLIHIFVREEGVQHEGAQAIEEAPT